MADKYDATLALNRYIAKWQRDYNITSTEAAYALIKIAGKVLENGEKKAPPK